MAVATATSSALPSGLKATNGPTWPPRNSSLFEEAPSLPPEIKAAYDSDSLFVRYGVAEVKEKQRQLKAEADAKQEELRLMVGERYRDLLQASTSIISMAQSAQGITKTLRQVKAVISDNQKDLRDSLYFSTSTKDDTHLQSLQSLSSHIKLLLDSPEHLWRLLEQRQHLQAAWLFLLNRVVYRALLREEDDEMERWTQYGIDVMEQFPLVQSQWESVSQFQAQLIHKATLHLREHVSSPEDICATFLSLYLLNSHTQSEALALFFTQRMKALTSATHRKERKVEPSKRRDVSTAAGTKHPVKDVDSHLQASLEVIEKTIGTARDIFQEKSPKQPSKMQIALRHIQNPDLVNTTLLSPSLQLSTKALLSSLPSSAQFLFLPNSILSYRPFIDLDSRSSKLDAAELSGQIEKWLEPAIHKFAEVLARRLHDIDTIEDVWTIRTQLLQSIYAASAFELAETTHLLSVLNDACQKRILAIWTEALASIGHTFHDQLNSILTTLDGQTRDEPESRPDSFLLRAPSIPTGFHTGLSSLATSPFLKYKDELHQQALGRTPGLRVLLDSLEKRSLALKNDLATLDDAEEESRPLVQTIMQNYGPATRTLCTTVVNSFVTAITNIHGDDILPSISVLVRITDAICFTSPFLSHLNLESTIEAEFRQRLQALHDSIVERWREKATEVSIHQTIAGYYSDEHLVSLVNENHIEATHPSSILLQSLSSIIHASETLAVIFSDSVPIAESSFEAFAVKFVAALGPDANAAPSCGALQMFVDVLFLQRFVELWHDRWQELRTALQTKRTDIQTQLGGAQLSEKTVSKLESNAADCLVRMQTVVARFLPAPVLRLSSKGLNENALLPLGASSVPEQKSHTFLELAESMPRFGMLLVGHSDGDS